MNSLLKIKQVLQENKDFGLNINGISRESGLCKDTVRHWLNCLERQNEVRINYFGSSKVFKLDDKETNKM